LSTDFSNRVSASYRRDLRTGLNGKRCVQVWHGYSTAIFVGFGETILLPTVDGSHAEPPSELYIWCAEWRIERAGKFLASSDKDIEEAQKMSFHLVGRSVQVWEFVPPHRGLHIVFENEYSLTVLPSHDFEYQRSTAWWLRKRLGVWSEYIEVMASGQLKRTREKM
jgi:hypothetical protein